MNSLIDRLFGLSGAVALVTGSSAGIGLALARGLAGAGARVVVNGRTPGTLRRRSTRCAQKAPTPRWRSST